MRVMYPNWKVPYRPNNREKFGMSGKKISCLWFGIVFIIWQNLKKKQQVQKWNFNSVRFFFEPMWKWPRKNGNWRDR